MTKLRRRSSHKHNIGAPKKVEQQELHFLERDVTELEMEKMNLGLDFIPPELVKPRENPEDGNS